MKEPMRINTETSVNQSDIIFMKSVANYTSVHTMTKKYISSRTLKVLADRINDSDFIKIKRGIIININYLKNFNNDADEAFVMLSDGTKLPVSRRLFACVCKGLNALTRND
jgi:two-component system, LytTR family, response regulator